MAIWNKQQDETLLDAKQKRMKAERKKLRAQGFFVSELAQFETFWDKDYNNEGIMKDKQTSVEKLFNEANENMSLGNEIKDRAYRVLAHLNKHNSYFRDSINEQSKPIDVEFAKIGMRHALELAQFEAKQMRELIIN